MYKLVSSDCYTKTVSKALNNLEEKVSVLESKGFRVVGPAQVIKEDANNVVAYITMKL